MTRFVTAPSVGALAGALEMGILFFILTVVDEAPSGANNEFVYLGAAIGIIFGSFVGAVIGLVVVLLKAGSSRGLLVGGLAGLALALCLFATSDPLDDFKRTLAVIVVPAAASIGLISSAMIERNKV